MLVSEVGKPIEPGGAARSTSPSRCCATTPSGTAGSRATSCPATCPGEVIHLLRAPVGVVAAICPWNFPLAVLARKLAPALLTGNTLVIKPSEVTPLSTIELLPADRRARLSCRPGSINLVTGGPSTGAALVADELTSMVSFTGHRDTGKAIMAAAAANLTRVALELGGKAPAIVWRDADLDVDDPGDRLRPPRQQRAGLHLRRARACAQRLLEAFTERYVGAVEALRVGDPSRAGRHGAARQRGPAREDDRRGRRLARAEGASVVSGGGRLGGEGFAKGYWHAPTVLRDVTPQMAVMREETFGPVTPILGIAIARARPSRSPTTRATDCRPTSSAATIRP